MSFNDLPDNKDALAKDKIDPKGKVDAAVVAPAAKPVTPSIANPAASKA